MRHTSYKFRIFDATEKSLGKCITVGILMAFALFSIRLQ